jgi:hypothetical protein
LWSHRGHIDTSPPNRPLLHRAFKLKEVIEYNKAVLVDYQENHLEGPNAFPKWDKAKWLIRTHAIGAWEKKVRTRGSLLKSMAQLMAKLERDLHILSLGSSNRVATIITLHQQTQALHVVTTKNITMRKEAIEAKWIQMSGKPNKDFLAKPQASRKRIGNMTIDNVKDQPDLHHSSQLCGILFQAL